jgi:hypothetical protein
MNLADDVELLLLFLWWKGTKMSLDNAVQFFQGDVNRIRSFLSHGS